MSKYTTEQFHEIKLIVADARKHLAIVDECQKKLRSKGIKCYIDNDSKFYVELVL